MVSPDVFPNRAFARFIQSMKSFASKTRAFTLIELLAVVAILAILAGVGSAAISSAMEKGKMAAEISAAKTLITAFHAAAADRGGVFLPSHDTSAPAAQNASRKPVSMAEAKKRYPWRLAPYFNYAVKGTLLVGDNERQFMEFMNLGTRSGAMYDYAVSVFPALGINRAFVGGDTGKKDPNNECVNTVAEADRSLIVFLSAGTQEVEGYEYVLAPGAPGAAWSGAKWTDKSDPANYGYVHPRHGGKAVAAFLNGSVRALTLEELRDMRLWSRNAALQDDPNYKANFKN